MRLSGRKNVGGSVALQMTSMIDVVFLLLIFFMATSSFIKAERELDPSIKVNRPSAAKATSHVEPAIVAIQRGAGGFVFKLGGREFTSVDELQPVLVRLENKGEGAYVRSDDQAPYGMASAAIEACKTAGFANVTYDPRGE